MTQKFTVQSGEGPAELEYADVKTKKLIKLCQTTPNKSLANIGIVLFVIAISVFVYDYFKDIGRNISATKDLYNQKEGGVAKLLGFTKANMTRSLVKYGLIILSIIFFYLSDFMGEKNCTEEPYILRGIEKLIKYDEEGIPISIDAPKK